MRSLTINDRTIETSPRKASGTRECSICRTVKGDDGFYGGWQCKECVRIRMKDRHKQRWESDPSYRQNHNQSGRDYYKENKSAHQARMKVVNRKVRDAVLAAYGGVCQCCGESTYEFLSIDHINSGGNKHKKELGVKTIGRWLFKNNFPAGFQVLCHNCNMAKGIYGACPHQAEARKCAS